MPKPTAAATCFLCNKKSLNHVVNSDFGHGECSFSLFQRLLRDVLPPKLQFKLQQSTHRLKYCEQCRVRLAKAAQVLDKICRFQLILERHRNVCTAKFLKTSNARPRLRRRRLPAPVSPRANGENEEIEVIDLEDSDHSDQDQEEEVKDEEDSLEQLRAAVVTQLRRLQASTTTSSPSTGPLLSGVPVRDKTKCAGPAEAAAAATVSQTNSAVGEQLDAADLDNNAELEKLQQLRELTVTAVSGAESGGQQASTSQFALLDLDGVPVPVPFNSVFAGAPAPASAAEAHAQAEGHPEIRTTRTDDVSIANTEEIVSSEEFENEESDDGSCEFVGAVWKSFEESDDSVSVAMATKLRTRRRGHGELELPLDRQEDDEDDAGISSSTDSDTDAELEQRKKRRKISESEETNNASGSDKNIRTGTGSAKDIPTETGSETATASKKTNFAGKEPSGRRKLIKPFICPICSKGFLHVDSMQKHVSVVHQSSNLPRFGCLFCPERFAKIKAYKLHGLIHKGEKPFECEICRNRFATRQQRCAHTRGDHPSSLRFCCSTCSKRFQKMGMLHRHEIRLQHGNGNSGLLDLQLGGPCSSQSPKP